ncbi:MAG: hybrid sensor histidine kinase/response regulator [Myxococcota bacterium]
MNQIPKSTENKSKTNTLSSFPDLILEFEKSGYLLRIVKPANSQINIKPHKYTQKNLNEILPKPILAELKPYYKKTLVTGQTSFCQFETELEGETFSLEMGLSLTSKDTLLAFLKDSKQQSDKIKTLYRIQKKLSIITAKSPHHIMQIDKNYNLLYADDKTISLFEKCKINFSTASLQELLYPEEFKTVEKHLEQAWKGKEAIFKTCHKDKIYRIHLVPALCEQSKNAPASTASLFIFASDITQQDHFQKNEINFLKQLQFTQKMESLGSLSGGIAHKFNNLLMGILGNAGLAESEISPDSTAHLYISDIKEASKELIDLTKQLLAYSGQGKFKEENINLNTLISDIEKLIYALVPQTIIIRLNLAKNMKLIRGDLSQIQQLLLNIAQNAAESYQEKNGSVTISTGIMYCDQNYLDKTIPPSETKPGEYAFVEISDSGVGIDKEDLHKIFDPFFSTKFVGRGLGLAAVMGIIKGHNGSINIYSEPEEGTTFKVLFPVIKEQVENNNNFCKLSNNNTKLCNVLVIDDEPWVRRVVARILKKLGFSPIVCKNGEEGLEKFLQYKDQISFIFLDLTMPVMGGTEVFREIRKINSKIPVILSSGYNEKEIIQKFSGKGLAGFLQKPFSFESLKKLLVDKGLIKKE